MTTEPMYNGFTERELNELIFLIDDEPVDEEFLRGIRKKLVRKRKNLRQKGRRKPQKKPPELLTGE